MNQPPPILALVSLWTSAFVIGCLVVVGCVSLFGQWGFPIGILVGIWWLLSNVWG